MDDISDLLNSENDNRSDTAKEIDDIINKSKNKNMNDNFEIEKNESDKKSQSSQQLYN